MTFKMTYDERNRGNLDKLGDNTKALAYKWYDFCIKNSIDVLIYETIRTKEQQQQNVNSGASQTMKSYHIVGQALDFVPTNSKKEALWNGYGAANIKEAVAEAKRLGFEWGGDWTGFVDKPHLQYNYKGYGTDTFTGKTSGNTTTGSSNGSSTTTTTNATIRNIQSTLNSRYNTGLAVDGIPGTKTNAALIKGLQTELNKQYKAGLVVDGVWGPKTQAACVIVKKGAKGNITYILQARLYILGYDTKGVDGIFGNGTEAAVKAFQKAKGLAADGVPGRNTFTALFK